MSRLIVILLVSWAYVGCAVRTPPPVEVAATVSRGGVARVAVDSVRLGEAVATWAVSQPLVPTTPQSKPQPGVKPGPSACRGFRFDPPARYPEGTAILPQDLVVDLQQRLQDLDSAARWLLAPVVGVTAFADGRNDSVDGLSAEGANLVVCTQGPAPDLERRFAHPDLQFRRRDVEGRLVGPGPFMEADSKTLVPNPQHAGPPPHLDRIESVVAPDAALLMELGEADVALVYGTAADRLLAAGDVAVRLERAPAWDRSFALWLNPQARWLNDPRFRIWIAGLLDRQGMLQYLFAGRGNPRSELIAGPIARPVPYGLDQRPVSSSSVPRFALSFEDSDRHAEKIAARIKATLRGSRVEVTLAPTPRDELHRRMRDGRLQAVIVPTETFFEDPLLALRETSARLGPSADTAALVLDQAASLPAPEDRRRAALAAQDILLQDALVIPLLSVHAWLATRSGLSGVRAGPPRVLRFHEAGWVQ